MAEKRIDTITKMHSIPMSHKRCKSTISGVIYDILFDIHLFLSDNLNDTGNNSW